MVKPWEDANVAEACRRASDAGQARPAGPDPEEVIGALSSFDGTAAEKLRWFAVWLEGSVLPDWEVVRNLYEEAVRREPEDARVRHSWAVAAVNYADLVPAKERGRLLREATRLAADAVRLAPADADAHLTHGLALYADETCSVADAEGAFRAAVTLGDGHGARFYRAHALCDLGRWAEALRELRCVDEARLMVEFGPVQRWRIVRLRESIAVCLLRLGRLAEAAQAARRFLDVAERADLDEFEAPEQLAGLATRLPAPVRERLAAILVAKRRSDGLGGP